MENLKIPEGYFSPLTIRETEVAIKEVKDHFERALAKSLHLTRVSAPNRPLSCKVETLRIEKIRFSLRRRTLYRYECHPPR